MTNVLDILNAHAVFMSDDDEAEIDELVFKIVGASISIESPPDTADLAKRTCLCGARIDGFDEYHAHLEEMINASIS